MTREEILEILRNRRRMANIYLNNFLFLCNYFQHFVSNHSHDTFSPRIGGDLMIYPEIVERLTKFMLPIFLTEFSNVKYLVSSDRQLSFALYMMLKRRPISYGNITVLNGNDPGCWNWLWTKELTALVLELNFSVSTLSLSLPGDWFSKVTLGILSINYLDSENQDELELLQRNPGVKHKTLIIPQSYQPSHCLICHP